MRKIKACFDTVLANWSIRTKIRMIILLCLLLPLLSFTLIFFRITSKKNMEQSLESMTLSYDNNLSILTGYFSDMEKTMDNLLMNEAIYGIIGQAGPDTVVSQKQWFHDISHFFSYLEQCSDVDNIHLYIAKENLVVENSKTVSSFTPIQISEWYPELLRKKENRAFLSPLYPFSEFSEFPEDTFSYISILYSTEDFSLPIGLVRVEIDTAKIRQVLDGLTFTENSFVFVSDPDGNILVYANDASLQNSLQNEPQQSSIVNSGLPQISVNSGPPQISRSKLMNSKYYWNDGYIGSEKYIHYSSRINGTPYSVSIFVPAKELFFEQNKLYGDMIIGILLISVLAFLLADIIVSFIIRKISLLNAEMEKVRQGNFDVSLEPAGKDEISVTMENFLSMATQIKILMKEQYELGRAKRNAEFSALQAQINPHFLYNSLDLINCTALQEGVPGISVIVNALVSYYRLSLSRGEDIIPISQELKHAAIYVDIQNMRFDKKTQLNYEYESWMDEYLIPKITFQPLVENSVLHGILESEKNEGIIDIRLKLESSIITITISDNGVGMAETQLATLQNNPSKVSGYGVKNIDERIKLYFGPEYGLSFSSRDGVGTVATIRIPAVSRTPD